MQKVFNNSIVKGREMKKKCMCRMVMLLFAACLMAVANIPADAVDTTVDTLDQIEPYYVGATDASCGLNIASGAATCEGRVVLRSGYTASLTLNLQKSQDGKSWSNLKSWNGSGSSIKKTYYISKGYRYRVTFTAKVYNSSGTRVDYITITSGTKSY